MNMFKSFLNAIPNSRSEMVNEMEIPDLTLTPYEWTDFDSVTVMSDSVLSGSVEDLKTLSTDSSLPLSRAMTDSEIDYDRYRRFKNRRFSDPRDVIREALEAFPPGYLTSLNSFQDSLTDTNTTDEIVPKERLRRYNEELRQKMEKFFDEECRVYTPEDPGLIELQEALLDLDIKTLDTDTDSSVIP